MNHKHFITVAISALAAIIVSVICLKLGWVIIFQNLFYIPIIIACIYYGKNGFIFSIAISFFYLSLIIAFKQDSAVIIQALIRTVIFISIAGITAYLSIGKTQAEQVLEKSEDKFRKLLECLPLPLAYVNKDNIITFRNKRFIEIFGYTNDDVPTITDWWMNAYPDPQYRQRLIHKWTSAVKQAKETGKDIEPDNIKIICKDGSLREVVISGVLINDGLLVTFTDITERSKIEKALEESQQKFQRLVETLYDWIWEVDSNGCYTYVSPQIKNILGYEPQEILGKKPFDLMSSEEQNRISGEFYKIFEQQKPIISLENINLHKNGYPVVLETNGLPFYDAEGKMKGYRGTDRDITARKKAEHQLKERIKELSVFYSLAELGSKEGMTIEQLFTDFVGILPRGWQYPEICCARIVMGNSEFRSENFKESNWVQSTAIKVFGLDTGRIEIYYLQGKPDEDEGPFLKEERWLLDTIAERLGHLTERKKNEDQIRKNELRLTSFINILQFKARTIQEFLDNALNEAIKLTESKIGYIYFYNEDRKQFVLNTWSKDVMKECTILEPQTCYELDKTGIWGEAVRQRRPIILNDFQASHPLKKGYPKGHANLVKYLTLPIIKNDQIIAVVGVANKISDYNNTDVLQLSLLMDAVWNYVDIRKAEEALQQSSNMVKLLLDSSAEAIYGLDMNGLCTFNNAACLKMLGYEKHEDLLGKNMHDMIHFKHADGTPYDVHECPIFKAFNKGERAHIDNEVLWKKDGTSFNAEYWSYPIIKDNEVIGAVVTFLDITDKKKAEEELHKLSLATEQSPASIVITDTKGAIEYVNPTFIQITGYSFREVLGKNPRILKSGETPAGEYAKLWNIITSGGEWRGEFHNKKKNGELYWESAVISPIINEYGHTTHFLAVKEDITKRKHAEQALQVSITEREKLIKELQLALENVKTLQGLIPICANCKKIRDDKGYWNQVEGYLMEHTDAKFSHGLCPDCGKKLYGDLYDNAVKKDEERKRS